MSSNGESNPSRDDRELVKTLIESGSDTKGLTLSSGRLWLPVSRLVIPVAMPPLASYVWREAGSLSEIGRRLLQWATAYNGNFFLSTLSRPRDLPGCWPLLDLTWLRWPRKQRDGLRAEPIFDAELIDEVAEDYPLVIRNMIPRAGAGRRPPYAISPSLYPTYPAVVYLPVVSEENVASSTAPFISRPGILPIHQHRQAQEPHLDWQPEPIYPSQPPESIWPPFIRFLGPHRLPVVKPFPVIRPESSPFIKSVTTRPEPYLTPDIVTVEGQTAQPLFEVAQPTAGSDSRSVEASSHLLYSPYQGLPITVKTIAVRPEKPLVSRTVGSLKEPELNLLKPERLIPDKALELPTSVATSKAKVEPSLLSMPLVSPLIPTVAEAPAVENVAGYPATLMPAQNIATPPAAARVEISERQPEAGDRLLPFQEQLSLTGFRPESVPLAERIDQTSATPPPLRFERAGRASIPERMAEKYSPQYRRNVPSPARIEEARQPVSQPPVSPGTESRAEFTATYRAGLLSMFETQAAHERPPAPELALAPISSGRRAESTSAPSSQAETRAEERTAEMPAPDLEAIANDVYRILKRRLARERERAFGVS